MLYGRKDTYVQPLQYQNDLRYHYPRWGFDVAIALMALISFEYIFPLLQVNQQFGRIIKGEDSKAKDLSVNRDFLSSGLQLIFGQL